MKIRHLLLCLLPALLTACSTMPPTTHTGFRFESIQTDERPYDYIVYLPRAYDGKTPMPLILFLHGYGESGTDGQHQMAVGLGPRLVWDVEEWPFIVVMPQKPADDQWADHAGAIRAMLDSVLAEHQIDRSRMYLTGLSQGGNGTWTINAAMPDTFAAIAPVCGYGTWTPAQSGGARPWSNDMDTPELRPVVRAAADVPVWAFHGTADNVVPADQTRLLIKAIEDAGGTPQMTLFPGVGHNAWDGAYSKDQGLAEWFLSHRRDGNR